MKPSTAATYTVTLTNSAGSQKEADRAKIEIPAGFIVDGATVQATTSAAGACIASAWVADGTLIAGGKLNLKRPDGNPNQTNNRLCQGGTLTVVFSATSSAADGSYTWATELLRGDEAFTLTGSQPSVRVDGTAPVVTVQQKPSDPSGSQSATFTFIVSEPADVTCTLDDAPFSACTSPVDYSNLADGEHSFTAQAVDSAGNIGQATYGWRVDATAPTIAITEKPSDPSNSTSATFAFTSSEPAMECRLDDAAFATCSSPVAYADLAQGPHTFTVKAIDSVGNTDQDSYTWTVDSIPPTVAITGGKPSDPTNSPSATFTFTASDPTQCKLDAGVFAACASPKDYSNLADGPHTFTVQSTDAAGNTSQDSYTWTVDTTPPTVAITGGELTSPISSTSASFSFTASDPTECKLDGGDFAGCSSPATYTNLADGPHTFTVRAIDAAQNSALDSHTWTVDTAPPTVQVTGDKPGDPTNSTSATFTFTSSELSTFDCKLDTGSFAGCSSPKGYTSLADGQHTFTVRATDLAGNTSQDAYTWAVDSQAPTVAIGDRPPTATQSRSATFTFTADAPTQCKLEGVAFADCASPATYSGLPDGSHTFTVKATDAAGNTGEDVYTWTVDNVAPSVIIVQKPTDPSDVKSPTFAFTFNEGTAQCKLDGGAFAACQSPTSYTNLVDGQHTFTVRSTDAAGNTGQDSYTWRLETQLAVATIIVAPSNPSTATSARFEFRSRPGATFECSLDGAAFAACASPMTYGGLAQGLRSFAVRAKDVAGTGPSAPYSWRIDSVGPSAGITQAPGSLTSSRSATFGFTANEAGSFACQLDGAGFGPCASPVSYQGLGDGTHTFTVRPTDVLGNVGGSVSYGWRVDGTPPETTLASAPAARTTSTSATFTFSADEPAAFQCKLDAGAFAPCASPKTFTGLTRTAHAFEVRALDAAGNVDAAPATHRWTVTALATRRTTKATSALLAPRPGARVTSPPLLRWRRVPRASYYNVQLLRGSAKVLSAWPTRTRLQLRARWRYLGRQRRLTPGTYRWYVWPGYGKAALRRYGRLLGSRTFTVKARAPR